MGLKSCCCKLPTISSNRPSTHRALAKHRQASALDVTDVQMHLGTNCNSFNIFFIHLLYQNRAAMEHVAPGLRNRRVATVQTGTCNRSTQAANGLDKKANKKVLIVE